MKIKFSTNGLLRDNLGTDEFMIVLPESASLQDVVDQVASRLEGTARNIIVDDTGVMQKGMLVVVNDEMIQGDEPLTLESGDHVSILMPMAGG